MLVEANSKPHDIVIYTDDSVTRDQSGWGLTVKQGGRTVHEDNGAHRVTTSSLVMEVEAVKHAIQWLVSQCDAQITHAINLTDSMNLLLKVESRMGCPNGHTAMHSLRLQRLLRIYFSGHTGVSGNERVDILASISDITSGLQLGRAEVLRGLRNFLNMDRPEHHSIDLQAERGVEKGIGRHPPPPPPHLPLLPKVENDLSSTRQILALFRGQPWRDCWDTELSAHGPFRALRCHIELKLNLHLKL